MDRGRDRIASLVTEHGEVIGVSQDRPPSRSYGARFMIMFIDEMARASAEITSGATLRVLLRLPAHLDFQTFRRLDQCKLAKELKMSQATVSRALNELHERELVEREGKGPVVTWRLSPFFGWNGTVEAWHAEKAKRDRTQKKPGKLRLLPQNVYYGK